ncbi:uncharacterized protein LOC102802402, partial [Saccoglossus kowalevskii]|uniref:Uncharacterized protein LOC102802402 n=1 Tax=Saccoglossus kowalevskii TaxID=10224 RepID=A0ABM0MPY6_SACKO
MKQKLEFMSREESRAKADAEECKKSIEKEKLHQREKIQELKQEILKLNSQLHEAQNTGRSECSVLRNELIKKDGEITQLKLDLEENRIKLQHSMRRAVEVSGLRSQVQQFRDQAMDAEKIAR